VPTSKGRGEKGEGKGEERKVREGIEGRGGGKRKGKGRVRARHGASQPLTPAVVYG